MVIAVRDEDLCTNITTLITYAYTNRMYYCNFFVIVCYSYVFISEHKELFKQSICLFQYTYVFVKDE